jgi:hypothetical protein
MGEIQKSTIESKGNVVSAHSTAPIGIKTDYQKVFAVGTGGTIDEKTALNILSAEMTPRFQESSSAIEKSWGHLKTDNKINRDFLKVYAAFREAAQTYPITKKNWHSGERGPLIHAEEVANDSVTLAFQAHYKSAYQRLREIIEMTMLQIYFYQVKDKSVVARWGRNEIKTPTMSQMLDLITKDRLFQIGDNKLGITSNLRGIYDNLGAYVHTRGIPTINMGLVGSNVLTFNSDAFNRFITLFSSTCHCCIVLISAFFPASIIYVPAFSKVGYLHPNWLPRKEKVECIRSPLTETELKVLEDMASQNSWFNDVLSKTASMPDLTTLEIDETYQRCIAIEQNGVEEAIKNMQKVNELFE